MRHWALKGGLTTAVQFWNVTPTNLKAVPVPVPDTALPFCWPSSVAFKMHSVAPPDTLNPHPDPPSVQLWSHTFHLSIAPPASIITVLLPSMANACASSWTCKHGAQVMLQCHESPRPIGLLTGHCGVAKEDLPVALSLSHWTLAGEWPEHSCS